MKKYLLTVIVCGMLFLSACAEKKDEAAIGMSQKQNLRKELESFEINLPKLELEPAEDAWMESYLKIMKDTPAETKYVLLIDFNFDDVPELCLVSMGSHNTYIHHIYSYREGNAKKLILSEMPALLEFYKDKNTGEEFWVANDMYYIGRGYEFVWEKITFREDSVKAEPFFYYRDILSDSEEVRVFKDQEESMETTREKIEQERDALFSQYEIIDTVDLTIYYGDLTDEAMLDSPVSRERLFDFFESYKSESLELRKAAD